MSSIFLTHISVSMYFVVFLFDNKIFLCSFSRTMVLLMLSGQSPTMLLQESL